MRNILKRFVGLATPSNQSEFKKAVIVLTAYYTIGVVFVLIVFNIMVYGLFGNSINIEKSEGEHFYEYEHEDELGEGRIQAIQDDLARILLISDIAILILTLLVAYASSQKTLKPLEEAYKRQARFVADAAHELRTPLSVMQAGSEVILKNKRTEEEYIKYIQESLEEVRRLTTLSNDLLFLASNNKKKTDAFSNVSISEICKKQIETMQHYAEKKKISIEDSIEEGLLVWGNNNDLIRLVINLLRNSIDYNREGGTVTVSLKKNHGKIILSIKDTGIGIRKEDIPYIFERFYKADNSRSRTQSGTGLGLAIVKEIVTKHQGSIKIKENPEGGTIFEVIL